MRPTSAVGAVVLVTLLFALSVRAQLGAQTTGNPHDPAAKRYSEYCVSILNKGDKASKVWRAKAFGKENSKVAYPLKLFSVKTYSTQVVSGSMNYVTFEVMDKKKRKYKLKGQVWEQVWLKRMQLMQLQRTK